MTPLDTQPIAYFPELFAGGVSPEILRQEIDLTDLETDELEEVSVIVTTFFCQELLNEIGGKVVVVPSYVIPKRGAKPYKKLVSFCLDP